MGLRKAILWIALASYGALLCRGASGQASAETQAPGSGVIHTSWVQIGAGYSALRANNATMAELQPTWMAPITQVDPRLGQSLRFSVSQSTWPGARPIAYGNNHGVNLIAVRRLQFELVPPSFFRNHSATLQDGFGNASVEVKARLASGAAENGNYIVTAVFYHGFAPRANQNGELTSYYRPAIAGGRMFGPLALLSSLGGDLPTGKIDEQGRGIMWKGTAELRSGAHEWFDVEDNALFIRGGPFDGKTQNFIAPGAFYVLRRAEWKPTHPALVLDCGMQMATSHFHYYDHNLVTEMRVIF
jgi:hypothetical protein